MLSSRATWLLLRAAAPLAAARAQETAPGKPAVFLDCDACDAGYLAREIEFVTWVRDRDAADVHALVAAQVAGDGGTAYTVVLLGRGTLAGLADTLRYAAAANDTEDAVRRGLAHTLSVGLGRYALRLPVGRQISILYEDLPGGAVQSMRDPWHHWVFTLRGNGYVSAQRSTLAFTGNGSFGIDHVTPAWKVSGAVSGGYSESRFDVEDSTIVSRSHQGDARGLVVRAIGEHVSGGVSGSWSRNTFTNTAYAVTVAPAVEYDLFPYSQSATRQLRFLYRVVPRWYRYFEETIYEVTAEHLTGEELSVTLDLRESWGSAQARTVLFHYFQDWSKNRVDLSGTVWLRLGRGLSLTSSLFASSVRDQLYLPRRGATEEEILLRQRQLASDYTVSASVGLSYSFGSVVTGVINPRFGD